VIGAACSISRDPLRNSPKQVPAADPRPQGAELIFHDPLPTPEPEQGPARSGFPVTSLYGSPESQPKRLKKEGPATRADRLEAVSRELKLLARGRGRSAG
jgi:hypothetical protein